MLTIRKSVDKNSPLIEKAIGENSVVDATFVFSKRSDAGFYEVHIQQGRVVSVHQHLSTERLLRM